MRMQTVLRCGLALFVLGCMASVALTEFRIGVIVENPDEIAGALIKEVKPNSVADNNLGLMEGDIIRYIVSDRRIKWRIETASHLAHVLGRTNDEVTVLFLRSGKLYSSTAKKAIETKHHASV